MPTGPGPTVRRAHNAAPSEEMVRPHPLRRFPAAVTPSPILPKKRNPIVIARGPRVPSSRTFVRLLAPETLHGSCCRVISKTPERMLGKTFAAPARRGQMPSSFCNSTARVLGSFGQGDESPFFMRQSGSCMIFREFPHNARHFCTEMQYSLFVGIALLSPARSSRQQG